MPPVPAGTAAPSPTGLAMIWLRLQRIFRWLFWPRCALCRGYVFIHDDAASWACARCHVVFVDPTR